MSNKMSDVFDLPVGDSEFTLVAMAKSTYMSMDKAAVIAINAYDANQDRIAELEKENRLLKQLEQIFNNSPDLTFDCCERLFEEEFEAHNLEQQAKGCFEAILNINAYSKNGSAFILVRDANNFGVKKQLQAKALKESKS
jgi:hypothetical protein